MSLTSYRAAPPRAKRKSLWDLSRLRHSLAVMHTAGANPLGFVSCKGRTIVWYADIVFVLYNTKGRVVSGL